MLLIYASCFAYTEVHICIITLAFCIVNYNLSFNSYFLHFHLHIHEILYFTLLLLLKVVFLFVRRTGYVRANIVDGSASLSRIQRQQPADGWWSGIAIDSLENPINSFQSAVVGSITWGTRQHWVKIGCLYFFCYSTIATQMSRWYYLH